MKSTRFSRRIARLIFLPLEYLVVASVNVIIFLRLANMQLDGLPTLIGVLLALMAASTSLLFNRARAYPEGAIQRRSLLVAELCLRATLLAIIGAVIAGAFSIFLPTLGYKSTPMNEMPQQWVPSLLAFFPSQFFLASSLLLVKAGALLSPKVLAPLHARDVVRALR